MNLQQLSQADLLDILFEGRNKEYGAYDLRKSYNGRLMRAILTMLTICLLLFIGFTVMGRPHTSLAPITVIDCPLSPVEPPAMKKAEPIVIPRALHPAPPAPTIRLVTTRIVPDDQVRPEDKPQPAVVPDNFRIDVTTNLNATGTNLAAPPSNGLGDGVDNRVVNKPVGNDTEDGIFTVVQVESTYKGGDAAWQRFLLKNFRPPQPEDDQVGDATVTVLFIVDKEGNVSNVEAISGPAALKKEAVRVIRLSGKWEPAIQNGRKVKSYKKQPITVHWEN